MHEPLSYQGVQLGCPVTSGLTAFLEQSSLEVVLKCLFQEGVRKGKIFSWSLNFEISL